MSWHLARLFGKTVSGTDLEAGWELDEQFAESALDTLCAARNRGLWSQGGYRAPTTNILTMES
jgi:hypothetical protein